MDSNGNEPVFCLLFSVSIKMISSGVGYNLKCQLIWHLSTNLHSGRIKRNASTSLLSSSVLNFVVMKESISHDKPVLGNVSECLKTTAVIPSLFPSFNSSSL